MKHIAPYSLLLESNGENGSAFGAKMSSISAEKLSNYSISGMSNTLGYSLQDNSSESVLCRGYKRSCSDPSKGRLLDHKINPSIVAGAHEFVSRSQLEIQYPIHTFPNHSRNGELLIASQSPWMFSSLPKDSSIDFTQGNLNQQKQTFTGAEHEIKCTQSSMSDEILNLPLDGDDAPREDEDIVDCSGFLYENDDTATKDAAQTIGTSSKPDKTKGRKGLPAKNLMAERRRRKKLNDRLYMLRSVVPRISKMDRASILGDTIEYLKELLQRINDLHNELKAPPDFSTPTIPSGLPQPMTSTGARLGACPKDECPTHLPIPTAHPTKVEVKAREAPGKALNIHMFCESISAGLLLSTMRALDTLGLDVQQAVISCFNGFALDVFRAEQTNETIVCPEEVEAVLLHTAACHDLLEPIV